MPKILMVVTSHDRIDADHPTGLWLEEFSTPWRAFKNEGFDVVVASPRGGKAPVDPRSLKDVTPDQDALTELSKTVMLMEVGDAGDYDAVFIPGGHGTMWDLATDAALKALLTEFDSEGKVVAAVCHGPAAFVDAIRLGEPATLVEGRRITAFTDSEERAVGLDKAVPFLLASKLREQGANVVEGADWADHVEVDGRFVTGQNPQSSGSTAKRVIEMLKTRATS
jgi:putative intracellular protease/amidase